MRVDRVKRLRLWAFLLSLAIGLLASWPFLENPGLPRGTDAELHVFRAAELGYSLIAGNLYPRWAPDFYHGYGYPIFNYYAPFTYHLTTWLTLGHPELSAVGVKLCFVLAHILGAGGAFQLGQMFGGVGGGLLSALAFSVSPYILLINPHVRGDLAEVFALAALPWALWGWELVWHEEGRWPVFWAVASAGVVLLSHNLTGLTMLALVGTLSLWHLLAGHQSKMLRQVVIAAVALTLLTAFFWFPFLAERRAIKLDVAGEGHYDFRNHFVTLAQLLSPLERVDVRAAGMLQPMSAGPQVLALGLGGLVAVIIRRRSRHTGYYALAAVTLLFMMTPASLPVWEAIPFLAYFQFPWRFLGPLAALCVPLVASLALPLSALRSRYWMALAYVTAVCVLLVPSAPGLVPPTWKSGFGPITPQTIVAAELDGRWRGTTSTNDFVPVTVEMIPGPQPSVLASYASPPVDRVNRATLPASAHVTVISDKPWINRFHVASPEQFLLRLFLFDFPGWRAEIDGQQVPIHIAHPEGFVTVKVPAGEHEVVVRFGSTGPRMIGWGLSGVGLAVFANALIGMRRKTHAKKTTDNPMPTEDPQRAMTSLMTLAVVLSTVLLARALLLGRVDWLRYASPVDRPGYADHFQYVDFGGEIALKGFDLSPRVARPGDTIEVTLYWEALRPVTVTYQSFVHLVYPEGHIWSQSDHLNPGGFPTNLWPVGRYVGDKHRLTIPKETPPGTYLLSVGLYSLAEGWRPSLREASCGQRSDYAVLCRSLLIR